MACSWYSPKLKDRSLSLTKPGKLHEMLVLVWVSAYMLCMWILFVYTCVYYVWGIVLSQLMVFAMYTVYVHMHIYIYLFCLSYCHVLNGVLIICSAKMFVCFSTWHLMKKDLIAHILESCNSAEKYKGHDLWIECVQFLRAYIRILCMYIYIHIYIIRRPLPTAGGARQRRDSKQWGPWPAGPLRISGAQAPFWITQLIFL